MKDRADGCGQVEGALEIARDGDKYVALISPAGGKSMEAKLSQAGGVPRIAAE